jgi:hypothetical protein
MTASFDPNSQKSIKEKAIHFHQRARYAMNIMIVENSKSIYTIQSLSYTFQPGSHRNMG